MNLSRKSILLTVLLDSTTSKEIAAIAAATGYDVRAIRAETLRLPNTEMVGGAVAIIVEHANAPLKTNDRTLELLRDVRVLHAGLRRLLVSEPCDLPGVVDGLHDGTIDSILYRPIDMHEFRAAMRLPHITGAASSSAGRSSVAHPRGGTGR